MSETNVGANLMFARRTTIVCEPMSEAIISNSFSNIGLIPVLIGDVNRGRLLIGDVYDFMLFSESFYFLQENFNVIIEEKHKIIDVPFLPHFFHRKKGDVYDFMLLWQEVET